MLTLGFWLFALFFFVIFLANNGWWYLIFLVAAIIIGAKNGIQKRKEAEREAVRRWAEQHEEEIAENDYHYIVQDAVTEKVNSAHRTKEEAKETVDNLYWEHAKGFHRGENGRFSEELWCVRKIDYDE